MLNKSEAIGFLNELGSSKTPFSFYCDFLGEQWCIEEGHERSNQSFKLDIDGKEEQSSSLSYHFHQKPIAYSEFLDAFERVLQEINIGNSYLTNLTFQTPIETNLTLEEIYRYASAKYKILVSEKFVSFSPETFIKIRNNNRIYSYPMKGTIDADVKGAASTILKDAKETAEHITIVDLIRNDLGRVANEVEVTRFRYLEEVKTSNKNLLQVSSEIVGSLHDDWNRCIGDILVGLLPAGSISGAPKAETMRIIQETETYTRGFYTGICGHYDGATLDTGVMIRFIKMEGEQLYYCSGGGITTNSNSKKEYQELLDKIYLPF